MSTGSPTHAPLLPLLGLRREPVTSHMHALSPFLTHNLPLGFSHSSPPQGASVLSCAGTSCAVTWVQAELDNVMADLLSPTAS